MENTKNNAQAVAENTANEKQVVVFDYYDNALNSEKANEAQKVLTDNLVAVQKGKEFANFLLNADGDNLLSFYNTLNIFDEKTKKFRCKMVQRAKYDNRARIIRDIPLSFGEYCKQYLGLTEARASTQAKIALFIDNFGNDLFGFEKIVGKDIDGNAIFKHFDIAITTIERITDNIPRKVEKLPILDKNGKQKTDKNGKLKFVEKRETDADYRDRILNIIDKIKTNDDFTTELTTLKELTAETLLKWIRKTVDKNDLKPTENAPTENAPTENAPTDEKPTENAPTDEKPTENAPTDEKPTIDYLLKTAIDLYGLQAVKALLTEYENANDENK